MSRFIVLLVAAIMVVACSADTPVFPAPSPAPPLVPPETGALDGTWRAVQWIAETGDGRVWDVLAEGGGLTLGIHAASVSGTMHVPSTISGSPVSADMSGTWRVAGDSVQFVQVQDTFVQRVVWWRHDTRVLWIVGQPVESARFTVVLLRDP